jgi:rhamnose transport system substrate-binding protein
MSGQWRRLGRLAIIATLAATAASCSSDDDKGTASSAAPTTTAASSESTSAASTAETTAAPSTEASTATTADAPSGETLQVVYIPKDTSNAYFNPILEGMQQEAAGLNMEVTEVGPAKAEASSQIEFIDAAIQQGVDAIAISPNDPETVVPSLKRAMEAGITVIAVNSDMNPDGRQIAIIPVDFSKMSDFLLKLTTDVTGGSGDFAILSATVNAPDQSAWIDGVNAALDAGKAPDLNLVDTVFGDDDADKSASETEALLTSYPDLKAILAPTAAGLPAVAQVLSNSSQKGTVQVTGLALPNSMKSFVEDGTVKEFGLWDPKTEGIVAAHLIAGLIDGSITAEAGSFDVPGLGTREISADTQIIADEFLVFDADNIADFDF